MKFNLKSIMTKSILSRHAGDRGQADAAVPGPDTSASEIEDISDMIPV